MAAKKSEDDTSLKRLGGGRWQTRDERFTIEPQSGTWALVDAEQTDELGLPLVRGPYRSLTDAKAAVEAARGTDAPASPLADRVKQRQAQPSPAPASPRRSRPKDEERPAEPASKPKPRIQPPSEPRWIADLPPRERGRARRLIDRLAAAGVRDAENVVRQDLTGGVATIARLALADGLARLLPDGAEANRTVERAIGPFLEVLDDGYDDELAVRWRLVDGDGRPIGLTAADVTSAVNRRDAGGKDSVR